MASTALESARQAHEEVERLTRLAVQALQPRSGDANAQAESALGARTPGNQLEAERLARTLTDAARTRCAALADIYEDRDGELHWPARGPGIADALSTFYAQLMDIRQLHRGADRAAPDLRTRDEALVLSTPPVPPFSAEEARGRCLDLHELHARYVNVAGSTPGVEYVAYVRAAMVQFTLIPMPKRRARAYEAYLRALAEYLAGFADRAYPLEGVEELVLAERRRLEKEVQGICEQISDEYASAELLLDALGEAGVANRLNELGLKAGGRPHERAQRLLQWARKGKVVERVVLEGLVRFLGEELLAEERVATAMNAEKKLSLSYAEIEAERRAEEAVAAGIVDAEVEDVEEEEAPVYNPKDVPLGWDGKPIPYWLYKLHGLNHEFKCEICGDAVYRGPRAFERHFSTAQHVQGLRCLGISYSKEFLMITRIADATALNERLQKESAGGGDGDGEDLEFEDSEGNVLSKKTYDDLSRQGLL